MSLLLAWDLHHWPPSWAEPHQGGQQVTAIDISQGYIVLARCCTSTELHCTILQCTELH